MIAQIRRVLDAPAVGGTTARIRHLVGLVGGPAAIGVGTYVLRQPSGEPVAWGPLQDTLSAVFPNPVNVVRGTAIIVLGCWLFQFAADGQMPLRLAFTASARPVPILPRRPAFVLLGVAGLVYAAVVGLLWTGSTGFLTGGILLISIVLASVGVWLLFPRPPRLFTRWEWGALTLVAIAAFVLYVHDAQNWYFAWIGDEEAFFADARGLLVGGPGTANIFSQFGTYHTHPVMDAVYQAAFMKLLGTTAFGWRSSCAVATALPVFPLYLMVRLAYSRLAGILAVGFYVPAQAILAYAHIGYNQPNAIFPLVGSVAAVMASRVLRAPFYLFLAGVFAGMGWYTLSVARLAIALVVLGLLFYRPRTWAEARRDAGLVLGGFALVLVPFVVVNGYDVIQAMIDQSRWGLPGVPPLTTRLSQNGLRAVFAYVYSAEVDNHYIVGALWDNVSAVCLLLGMAALLAWKRAAGWFLLLCYWFQVVADGATYYALHLNTTRMYVVAPYAAVIAGIGGATLLRRAATAFPLRIERRLVVVGGAAGLVVAAIVLNLYTFYRVVPDTMYPTPQVLEMKVFQDHPEAMVVETGVFAATPFDAMALAYGVLDRMLVAQADVPGVVRRGLAMGRPVIVVSTTPLPPGEVHGHQEVIWDAGHHVSIYATFVR